jgi:anti-anti-sigma factor
MLADLRFEHSGSVVVARLSGDVDMSNADEVAAALLRSLSNEVLALVLDLSDVDYFDSAGIHLVYDLRERLQVRGQKLRMVVPQGSSARDTLELAAVLRTMDVDESTDAALAAVANGLPESRPS